MPTIEELLQEGSTDIVRGHLRKIVEIYDIEWRVAHELVQNAVDAVQAKQDTQQGEVAIFLNLANDEVTVEDNGIGFKRNHDLLRPGGTGDEKRLASRSPAKGYQGVGLKAVMYSTDRFEIQSQTDQEEWTFVCEGLKDYIDPEDPSIPEYVEEHTDGGDKQTYTRITAKFPEGTIADFISGLNRFLNEDSVRWTILYENHKDDLEREPFEKYLSHLFGWYFRSKSYVGCTNSLLGITVKDPDSGKLVPMKTVGVTLTVITQGAEEKVDGKIGEWLSGLEGEEFSTTMPYRAWDYAEVARANKQLHTKYRKTPEVVNIKPNDDVWDTVKDSLRDKFLDLKLIVNEEGKGFRERYKDFISILERDYSSVKAEDYRDVIEKITGIYLAIGRTSYFELMGITNHGMRIVSSNGTPTDHELMVRSTSSTWYLETIHFVVNVDSNLNIGKRHLVNSRLVGRLRDFFEACYPKLVSISKRLVKRDTRASPDVSMPDVVPFKKIEREGISFKRFPSDESTLVGLFSASIEKVHPDFSIFGLFRSATYDGKFSWKHQEILSDADLKKLEFKTKLDDLTNEFDHAIEEKEFAEVALIIVWDRRSNRDSWIVKGISPDMRNRLEVGGIPTSLVNYVLEDGRGNARPLLCVADILAEIPKRDGKDDDIDSYIDELG
jgi:anti-sigma regulatory factor (Ser/Thr protein kinase)